MEPITKDFFIEHLNKTLDEKLEEKLEQKLSEQRIEYQRYIGIVSEEFHSRLAVVSEMVSQNTKDISDMKEDINCIKSDVVDIRYDLRQKVDKDEIRGLRSDLRIRGFLAVA